MFFTKSQTFEKQQQCLEWNDYYDGHPTFLIHRITRSLTDHLEISEATNVYVYRCLFSDCSSESNQNGGVLSFTKANGQLLIEFSIFEECHSELDGGVVYVKENCDCVVNSICSYKCYATKNGQFIYTELAEDKINYVFSSTICSTFEKFGNAFPIFLYSGSSLSDSVNISNYNVREVSAIRFRYSTATSNVTYCSFVSNNAVTSICVGLSYSPNPIKYIIDSCNVVNNSQQNINSWGLIDLLQNTDIKHCNLYDNDAKYLICIDGWQYNYPIVTVSDTYVSYDDTYELSQVVISGEVNTNNILQNSFEIEFEFIDCDQLENRFLHTSDVYYYIFFLNFIRASLLPSISI